jgi:hypothetical protein
MAAFKGFGFTSPEEVIAKTREGFQQAQVSGNVHAMRAANVQQAAFALFGSPELRKAKAADQVLKGALKTAAKTQSGDDVQDQVTFLRAAQKAAIEAGLPEIAMQATSQLSTITVAQEERGRLKNREQRAADEFKFKMGAAEDERLLNAQQVLVDGDGNPIANIDITSQDDLDKMTDELRDDPEIRLVSRQEMFGFTTDQLLLQQKLAAEKELALAENTVGGNEIPPTTLNRFYQDASGQMTFAHGLDNMVDILGDDPDAFTAATSVESGISKLAAQGRATGRALGLEISQERRLQGSLEEAGVTDARRQAAVMDLAYALATSREGGRLTDQDIDRAITTLGFLDNPDPRMILAVLQDRVENARESWNSRGKVAGIATNDRTQETWQEVDKVYKNTQEKLNFLASKLTKLSDDEVEDARTQASGEDPTLSGQGLNPEARSILNLDTVP